MPAFRYSKWDGTQEPFPVEPEDIFRALADDWLEHGDVGAAVRAPLRRGVEAANGRRAERPAARYAAALRATP